MKINIKNILTKLKYIISFYYKINMCRDVPTERGRAMRSEADSWGKNINKLKNWFKMCGNVWCEREYGIKMVNKWSRHQYFVFGVIRTPKLIYETRAWIRGLITRREGISTLQRSFNERLPICSLSLMILSQLHICLFISFF